MKKVPYDLFRIENEIIEKCSISENRFHKVSSTQWENIYQTIAEKYADKTGTWKNGLQWANIKGYSPKSMKNFLGSFPVDGSTWFYLLPQIISVDEMVYFLINNLSTSCSGLWWEASTAEFWIWLNMWLNLPEHFFRDSRLTPYLPVSFTEHSSTRGLLHSREPWRFTSSSSWSATYSSTRCFSA